jgi:cell division protease FtsH
MDYDELGRPAWFEPAHLSPAMQEKVDNEVNKIVDACYKNSLALIKENRKTLDKVVEKLLIKETLDREDFEKIAGKKPS